MIKKYILTTCFSLFMTGACLAADEGCPTIDSSELATFQDAVSNASMEKGYYAVEFNGQKWFMTKSSRDPFVQSHAASTLEKISFILSTSGDVTDSHGGVWARHTCMYVQERKFSGAKNTAYPFQMTHMQRKLKKK